MSISPMFGPTIRTVFTIAIVIASLFCQLAAPPACRAEEQALEIPVSLERVFSGKAPRGADDLKAMQSHFERLSKKVMTATVGIRNRQIYGSGVIISKDGYVLTAAHVAGTPGARSRVFLSDGSSARAESLGMHVRIDMGLMKIMDHDDLPHLQMGDSTQLRRGHWCLATGFPGGFEANPHAVIRLGRVLASQDHSIKTDCTLISGDSGGPLVDMQGRVIGIHSRVGVAMDMNLHVPVSRYRSDWNRLVSKDMWGFIAGPYIGVTTNDGSSEAKVASVYPHSPAERAGIRPGDTVVRFADNDIENFSELRESVGRSTPGKRVPIFVKRGDNIVQLEIVVGDGG